MGCAKKSQGCSPVQLHMVSSTIAHNLDALPPITIIIMSTTTNQCHPEDLVGLFCFKCQRSDFGGSARRLSSHRQHCNGPKNPHHQDSSRSRKKRKVLHRSDVNFSTIHSNGMSQFPFLAKNRSLVGHENKVCFFNSNNPSEYDEVEIGNQDDTPLFNHDSVIINSVVTPHQELLTLFQLSNNNYSSLLHHPSIEPMIEATKSFNLNAALPSCDIFQMELARLCNRHRTDMTLFNEVNQLIKQHSIGRELSFLSENLTNRNRFVQKLGTSFCQTHFPLNFN